MEKNKTEQYTFGTDEKETLQAIATVEASVGQHIQKKNQRELVSTKYYSEFVINAPNGPVTLNNVFITAERNKEGEMSYHFRWIIKDKNGEQSLEENLVVNENGEIYASEGLKDYLGDAQIDIEELMSENDDIKKGRLKGISEKAEQEEMEIALEGEEKKENKEKEQDEEEQEEDEETQEIEEDLEEQGEDLKISKYRKIKDTHLAERMPDVFGNGAEYGVAFSNKLNRFVIISKVNGQYQINENVEPAKMTWKSIISIDPNGESVERKVPHALMKTNRSDKEIAVTIGQYGEVDIETVDVLPCQERIAREVRTDGEGINKQESLEMRNQFKQEGKEYPHDIAHQVQDIEKAQKDANKTVDYDITPDDYIPNTEPPRTWGELMKNTGESLPKLIERYNREMANEGANSKDVVDTIEQDYGNINRQHQR